MLIGDKSRIYKFTRQELKYKSAEEFNEGDTVICGKYYVHIKYGSFNFPRLLTIVSTRDDIRNLPLCKWPQYIREFVNRRKNEICTKA